DRVSSNVDPNVARTTVRNLLVAHADPIGAAPNNTFGAGRVDAVSAVQPNIPTWKGSATLTFDGNTPFGAALSPSQLGFSDPNQCALTRLNWTGGCGTSPGATMTCPFGAAPVTVSASNNGVGF